jgi:hypothetical protein
VADEDDVGANPQAGDEHLVIDAEAQATAVEEGTKPELRTGVALAVGAPGCRDGR